MLILSEKPNIKEIKVPENPQNSTDNKNSTKNSTIPTTIRYLEIWRGIISNNKIKYCLTQSSLYDVKENLGLFSLSDVNRDGALDIIFPVLESPPKILIAYNKNKINYDWTEDYCSTHVKYNSFNIPLIYDDFVVNKNTYSMQTISLSDSPFESFYKDNLVNPLIRFNDVNSDSYPDFIVTLYNKNNFTQKFLIFFNTEILINKKGTGVRTYSVNSTYTNPSINNVIYASFFDTDEDGKLDVILVYKESTNLYNTIGLFNTNVYDCFYLKSLILNGNKIKFSNKIGVNLRYVCADVDGTRRMDLANQAVQLNAISLNLPYAYIGVGRSNNYIENFHVINGNYANVNFF